MKILLLLLLASPVLANCTASDVIPTIRPGSQWTMTNNDLSTIVWNSTQTVPTQTEIDAAIVDCPNQTNLSNRNAAVNELLSGTNDRDKLIRAILMSLLDELNNRREWDAGMKAAVAASTSLADLKTRIATLPDAPDITVQQAKTAVQNKISSGSAD